MSKLQNILVSLFKNAGMICLVGGAVIDHLQGREIKDWDVEIYGLSLEQIKQILKNNNLRADVVGANFGIIKTKILDTEIDLSVPRKENKSGKGHKGFEIQINPEMSIKEASMRRDLTINSLSLCLRSDQIIDHFNGLNDLGKGCIKHVNATTFAEDPLRVLRVMQLLARKGQYVDNSTVELSRSIVDSYSEIPKERVFAEFEKLLLKSQKPSKGLRFLKKSGWLRHFPELNNLIGCQQRPEWHPEGDVWEHTLQTVDNAAQVRKNLPADWQLGFMFGMLCHDMGKPAVTTADLRTLGHDMAGITPARSFMSNITDNKKLITQVVQIVENHMQPGNLYRGNARRSRWLKLHKKIPLKIIGFVSRCDSYAKDQKPADLTAVDHPVSEMAWMMEKSFDYRTKPISGKDLIHVGFVPGPEFKEILDFAEEAHHDYKMSKKELLKLIIFGNRDILK